VQNADEPNSSNGGSPNPNKEEEIVVLEDTSPAAGEAGAVASSSVQGPAENAIVKASTSTASRRFSVSPIRSFLPAG